jgi:Domain of unknown function (DUF5666)
MDVLQPTRPEDDPATAPALVDDESWLTPDTRRRVRIGIPPLLLGTVMVVAGAFWGGTLIDKHFGAATGAALTSAAAGPGAEGAGPGGFSVQSPAAEGTIRAISGEDLTVGPASGAEVKVVLTASTVVTRSGKGTAGALHVGDTVSVQGTKTRGGTVTATSVTATAAGVAG